MEASSKYDTNEAIVPDAAGTADRLLDILEFLEAQDEPQTLTQIVTLGPPAADDAADTRLHRAGAASQWLQPGTARSAPCCPRS